eukprot:1159936-Pelagomonas_calceolata.AAC.8
MRGPHGAASAAAAAAAAAAAICALGALQGWRGWCVAGGLEVAWVDEEDAGCVCRGERLLAVV